MYPMFIPVPLPVRTTQTVKYFPRYYTYQPLQTTVVMGTLPADFLRLPNMSPTTQEERDRQAAIHLQNQMIANARQVPRGCLEITFKSAVLNKNYGLSRMDPYLRMKSENQIYETHTIPNGARTPHWNKTFAVYHIPRSMAIDVLIYDERTLTGDELIAWGEILIPESVFKGETVNEWYKLSGKLGDGKEGLVHVVMTYDTRPTVPMVANQQVLLSGHNVPVYTLPPVVVQPTQPPVRQITDDDIKQIKEIFPEIEESVVHSVLEACNGQKDAAINSLLQMQNT